MSDLQSLAQQKADAAMQQRLCELPNAIQALQRKLAAQGGLRSGAMLKQVLSICQQAMRAQSATLVTEYRWAVAQALLASQSWVERLIAEANTSIDPLYEACIEHMKRAVALAAVPRVEQRLLTDLDQTRKSAKDEVAVALRSAFAEKRRGIIRAFPSSVVRALSRLFGGGHA
jgi:hypothetical protein